MKTNLCAGRPEKAVRKHVKQWVGLLMASGLIALGAGCASDRPQRTAGESMDDQSTARRVQEALNADPAYKFTEVRVFAYQGKVQLSGFVDKHEQKDRAEDIAEKTPGVKDVRNDITLKK